MGVEYLAGGTRRIGARAIAALLATALAVHLHPAEALVAGGRKAHASVDPAVSSSPMSSVLVHVAPHRWTDARGDARALGLHLGATYRMIDVFVASGARDDLLTLATQPSVTYIESNAPLVYMTNTSHAATNGARVLSGSIRWRGHKIDGRGIGVAVVDTGVDGTHPDLVDRMGGNVRIICTRPGFLIGTVTECGGPKQAVELEDTDSPGLGGHGTHVAGIVAGTGAASDGEYHGAAPGATLYGVGMGTVLLVENALDGLRWVLDNHDKVKPRIRVVNNSWGSGWGPENMDQPETRAITKMIERLVGEGVTVVFSAGNSGGSGQSAATSLECTIPTPGVVCVANYDDSNSGLRDGSLASQSSRGQIGKPFTWPDLSAPGATVTSTCRPTLPVCNFFGGGDRPSDYYATLSGTSMAAPHVSGAIAQLLQVRPALTPKQIENLLEDSALKFKSGAAYEHDPSNADDDSSFDKGHGLLDVLAAIKLLVSSK